MDFGYKFIKFKDLILSILKIYLYKIIFGWNSVRVHLTFIAGSDFVLRIRSGGKIQIGNRFTSRGAMHIFCDGGMVRIGKNCFFNYGCSLNSQIMITVGDDTLLGEGVKIYDHDHMITNGKVLKNLFKSDSVIIGNCCWIGSNSIITKGVKIVDNVIIGAGSVITRSILVPGTYIQKVTITQIR